MTDVGLYVSDADAYNQIQASRPDYSKAIEQVVKFAKMHLPPNAVVADFCCGTGSVTKLITEAKAGVRKAILIDTNEEFLKIAKSSGIKSLELETKLGNILDVSLKNEADLVLSIFAYHHVPDNAKQRFIEQVKSTIKPEGILILGEIYSPNREATISYYNNVFSAVPQSQQSIKLRKFLEETARSEEFEFKVSKSFADKQFAENGFSEIESVKIWPNDNSDIGTFVQVFRN
jgi:ubiquinone/menaquinone biosynthesis C-methylase UbiE